MKPRVTDKYHAIKYIYIYIYKLIYRYLLLLLLFHYSFIKDIEHSPNHSAFGLLQTYQVR